MAETESESSSEENEGLTLYMCASCKSPLGDSADCVGKTATEIFLVRAAVKKNVRIDKTKAVSSYELDAYSTMQVLYCKGCSATIGALYVATPPHLDHKRDMFTLHTTAIKSYFLNAHKQRAKVNENFIRLPTIPYMEEQLKKCRTVFGYSERAVTEMENWLFESSETP